jgi:Endosomal/lysosomal potassium channel TMEM175
MLRKRLFNSFSGESFSHRGTDFLRIEALSDAVFAFSISLLVASLEVPQTFGELKIIAKGAIPFFATVALIFLFWYQQYIFFRRYGLNDLFTILLNLAYLSVILFYVYPLKFLFYLLISAWSGINLFPEATGKGLVVLSSGDFPQLIMLFSIGYFLIWLIIYLLHNHVLKLSETFAFNRYEVLFTQKEARGALWNALIGLFALAMAWLNFEKLAGICYLLIPLILIANQYIFKVRYNRAADESFRRRLISHQKKISSKVPRK